MKIADIMIDVRPIPSDVMTAGANNGSDYENLEHVPVVDAEFRYIGSVAREKLIANSLAKKIGNTEGLLDKSIVCLSASDDISSLSPAADEAVVLDDQGRVKGMITKAAIIGALISSVRSNIQLERVIEASPNGIVVVDDAGFIQIVNRTICEMLGLEKSEIIGRNIVEVVPTTKLLEVLATREGLINQKILIGNTTVLGNAAPIMCDGSLIGAISVIQDIDDLEKAAFELNEVKSVMREFESIFNSSYDGMTLTDSNGVLLRMNEAFARQTGLPGEAVGKKMKELVEKGYFDRAVTALVVEKKERITINQTIRGRQFLVTGNPIFDEEGNLFRVVHNVRDITQLVKLQDEIAKSKEQTLRYQSEISLLRSMNIAAEGIIFRSEAMEKAIEIANKMANVDSTVLITGESGTGKELIAKLIHRVSKGTNRPFIKINCAALPGNLLESELFGYEKGAFTGAVKEGKPGLFELANNGTLFLDEIGDMPLALQVKLLRTLQEKEVMRVGGTKTISINVRIVAATHRDLAKMVDEGGFRDDLYYRLMVVPIHLPPLRERKGDIPILVRHFIDKYNRKFKYNKSVSNQLVDRLTEYSWKGNVRELENVIERMVVTSNDEELTPENLPESIRSNVFVPNKAAKLKTALEQTEAYLLTEAYNKCRSWDEVAKQLGINRATAYRKAAKYDLLKL
jgi:PAS domain S-box-containing protein